MQEGKVNKETKSGEERANEVTHETGRSRFADPSGEDKATNKKERKTGALDFQMQMYSETTRLVKLVKSKMLKVFFFFCFELNSVFLSERPPNSKQRILYQP